MGYTLGIDMGASSVKLAALSDENRVLYQVRRAHYGSPVKVLSELLAEMGESLAPDACEACAVTGQTSGVLREYNVCVPEFEDVPAITEGAAMLAPEVNSIIAVGAQTALFLSKTGAGWENAPRFAVNESCASGTGSFFEDQMERLGMKIEDYSKLISGAKSIPRLSGRCAVFAKTDIIHRQQEGVPVEDILLGLCYAMVKSYKSTIVRGLPVRTPVLLAGGITYNQGVTAAVRDVFGLNAEELFCGENYVCLQAVGAAKGARRIGKKVLSQLRAAIRGEGTAEALPRLAPLEMPPENSRMDTSAVQEEIRLRFGEEGQKTSCVLGVDVGSTSTNLVLLDDSGRLIDYQYLRTRGNPGAVVQEGMDSIAKRIGKYVEIHATGVTGSGRYLIGKMLKAETIRDEITAQAKGAVMADPLADTVFEIGGQDSKYIHIKDGQVADFQMNKICAAGTGSFIEEQAARLGISLEEYGPLALSSAAPLDLGERCTVFVETAIHTALAKGAKKRDIAAGLCLSVVRNYLHKVVGTKPVGKHIVLQGGVAYNPATVAAFRQFYGDRITVSPWFPVSGAIGVAYLAMEQEARERKAEIKAFAASAIAAPEQEARERKAELKAFAASDIVVSEQEAQERKAPDKVSDKAAEKADLTDTLKPDALAQNMRFYTETKKLFLENYTPPTVESGELGPDGKLCCERKTVGIPRALMMHKLFPMANGFFTELGFRVVLSPESDEETIRLSQQTCRSECCYPVKLVHGHMAQLANLGVDYIFMPAMHTIRHICSRVEHNYACSFMQTAPRMAAQALNLSERGIELISPVLDMDFGEEMLARAMLEIGARFGKSERETALAMLTGGLAVNEFTRKTEEMGEEIVRALQPGEKAIVLITRQYGIEDPALNMDISAELLKRGYKVINLSHLHAHSLDISDEYPGMYWPFGQHILSGARIVRSTPGLYAIYLTNHGCGPDTMISHLFREEMQGKPYLQIEVDEHYSKVGVITRLEAFLNSLEQSGTAGFEEKWLKRLTATPSAGGDPAGGDTAGGDSAGVGFADSSPDLFGKWPPVKQVREHVPLQQGVLTGVPGYGKYGSLIADFLTANGFPSVVMKPCPAALEEGRKETTSKEYYTFAMLLGMSLQACGKYKMPFQLLIPANEGADADGYYWRVIRAILDEKGLQDAAVSTVFLERILEEAGDDALWEGLQNRLLMGDLYYMTPAEVRTKIWGGDSPEAYTGQKVCNKNGRGGFSEPVIRDAGAPETCVPQHLLEKAVEIRCAFEETKSASRLALLVTGEWPLVYDDSMASRIWSRLEEGGCRLLRMPFSEYLWFLWNDRQAGWPDQEREKSRLRLEQLEQRILQLHEALGEASAYSGSLDELASLASAELGRFTSANGRYRWAKKMQMAARVKGIVNAASMYENTDMILKDHDGAVQAPILNLSFDGVQDEGLSRKLKSFLYYL